MVLPVTNPTKSFWIEGADSPLRDLRTTPDLPDEVDVVIVGSGYTGASAAYWLQKFAGDGKSPSTLILEARDICGGATGRNGGQLRPHYYDHYPLWAARFGPVVAQHLIKHEVAHLDAFKQLLEDEGIADEVSFKLGKTFDAAMTEEAWTYIRGAYEQMKAELGEDAEFIRDVRLIDDAGEAEEYTQMKGCLGAATHPTGQVWPYKFVHALLRIVSERGPVNIQANTPVLSVSEKGADGRVTVHTDRGDVRTKAVIHATNRWASHLLPEFENLIFPSRGTLAAIKAPEGFIKHTGAQWWDTVVYSYHLQLPPPYNTIILGGAKRITVHKPEEFVNNDREDKQFEGVPKFSAEWPANDVVGWAGEGLAELEKGDDEGGVWTGIMSSSIDAFPFVGPVPSKSGHYVAAGFTGHGMPRILGSTAHLIPTILSDLGIPHTTPNVAATFPQLPEPFAVTAERVAKYQEVDAEAKLKAAREESLESSKKAFALRP
ncbi:hypothetical protein IAT38_008375 [Cryptococcus sp. DSM 104549]